MVKQPSTCLLFKIFFQVIVDLCLVHWTGRKKRMRKSYDYRKVIDLFHDYYFSGVPLLLRAHRKMLVQICGWSVLWGTCKQEASFSSPAYGPLCSDLPWVHNSHIFSGAVLAFIDGYREKWQLISFSSFSFSIIECLFNTALYNSVFINNTINTYFTVDGRCYPSQFPCQQTYRPCLFSSTLSLLRYSSTASNTSSICLSSFLPVIGSGIAINTASPFAFMKVAEELFAMDYQVADQSIFSAILTAKIGQRSLRGWRLLPFKTADESVHVNLQKNPAQA